MRLPGPTLYSPHPLLSRILEGRIKLPSDENVCSKVCVNPSLLILQRTKQSVLTEHAAFTSDHMSAVSVFIRLAGKVQTAPVCTDCLLSLQYGGLGFFLKSRNCYCLSGKKRSLLGGLLTGHLLARFGYQTVHSMTASFCC